MATVTGGRRTAAAIAACLVAVLAWAAPAAAWSVLDLFVGDPTCGEAALVERHYIDSNIAPCVAADCTEVVPGEKYSKVACDVPAVEDFPTEPFVVTYKYDVSDPSCLATPVEVIQRPMDVCAFDTLFQYKKVSCHDANTNVSEYMCISFDGGPDACGNETMCIQTSYPAGQCQMVVTTPQKYECVGGAEEPVCNTAAFTTDTADEPFWQVSGNELDADAVSATKDCLAVAADGTVAGGWTVVYSTNQVRGHDIANPALHLCPYAVSAGALTGRRCACHGVGPAPASTAARSGARWTATSR